MSAFEGATKDEDVTSAFREGDCVFFREYFEYQRGWSTKERLKVPKRVGVPKREGLESHTRRGVVEPKKGWITRGGVVEPKKG